MTPPTAARVGGDAAAAVVTSADRSFADAMSTAATIGPQAEIARPERSRGVGAPNTSRMPRGAVPSGRVLDPGLVSFVLDALPPAPARVLEIGAGTGELAGYLRRDGYDLLAIDPAADTPVVEPIALHEVDAPAASFDAALAVLSLHHVEPLPESCRRLAELVRPDGVLVIDEFDIAAFDMTAARWWLGQRPAAHVDGAQAESIVAGLREHLHPLARVLEALRPWFDLGVPTRGPYLYRWQLSPELRGAEEARIASGRLAATGARVVGRRRR